MIFEIFFVLLAYLVGAIPFGFLIGKYYKIDIRTVGSKNIGATNVSRVVGKRAGKVCFFLDFFKGAIPVIIATTLWKESQYMPVAVGIATILGHVFPLYLKFKGGKGIATAGGVAVALVPLALAIALTTWVIVFLISRYVSLASIVASIVLPLVATILHFTFKEIPLPTLILLYLVGVIGVVRHRSNIVRLINGTEAKFEKKDKNNK